MILHIVRHQHAFTMKNKSNQLWFIIIMLMFAGISIPEDALAQRRKAAPAPARPGSRPAPNTGNRENISKPATGNTGARNPSASNNAINNKGSVNPNINSGNRNNVNVDKSRGDVNINVDNSKDIKINNNRNTVVRHNNINTYHRPPYYWGGHRYYCYHPYYYHPYHPYYWGPVWHPWGFVVATLAVTAIVVSVNNAQYHYDQGVWYSPSSSGYIVVQAPVGGTITTVPSGTQTVIVNNTTNYYYGGAYYEKDSKGYTVVAPPAGAVVDNLPEGGEEVKIGDQTYVKVGETYYSPVQVDGKNKYEVVQVEDGK